MDELTFSNLIKDTQVLQLPREYVRWDWNLIYSLLQVSVHVLGYRNRHKLTIPRSKSKYSMNRRDKTGSEKQTK